MTLIKSHATSTIFENWKKKEIQLEDLWNLSKERLSHVFVSFSQRLLDNVFLTTSVPQRLFHYVFLTMSFSRHSYNVFLTCSSSQSSLHHIKIYALSFSKSPNHNFTKIRQNFNFCNILKIICLRTALKICSFNVRKENKIHRGIAENSSE